MSLAARRTEDAVARSALDAAIDTLSAHARAHRALQAPAAGGGPTDVSDYLGRLCQALARSTLASRHIAVTLVESPAVLDAERCWRLGLIVAELINNAARHAFAASGDGRSRQILVEARPEAGAFHCLVSDNGAASADPTPGLGSRIVDALAGELGGRVERRYGPEGSSVLVTFPLDAPPAA
jgi:two-component sensor histidine kinase